MQHGAQKKHLCRAGAWGERGLACPPVFTPPSCAFPYGRRPDSGDGCANRSTPGAAMGPRRAPPGQTHSSPQTWRQFRKSQPPRSGDLLKQRRLSPAAVY
eukprot:6629068-Pyramimonas_sp.AAC.1